MTLKLDDHEEEVRITGIYGEPEVQRRCLTWDLLRTLHGRDQRSWFIGGDFNEILHSGEKEGGRIRGLNQMMAFNLVLADCGLSDMGYVGNTFT